jgi:anti-sigma factor RsiW
MKPDEITLLAYCDRQLDASARAQVEAALAISPELQRQVDALQASRLPYATAFAAQALPALPTNLGHQLAAMTSAAASNPGSRGGANTPDTALGTGRRAWMGMGLAAAASFAAGWLTRPLLLAQNKSSSTASVPASATEAWVDAVANYQALYSRATVDGASQSVSQATEVLRRFLAESQLAAGPTRLVIPDLTQDGLSFKRAQRLSFRGKPLLQIAYLPVSGMPAALCVLAGDQAAPNMPAALTHAHGLRMTTWRLGALSYALASDLPDTQALALGNRIAAGEPQTLAQA